MVNGRASLLVYGLEGKESRRRYSEGPVKINSRCEDIPLYHLEVQMSTCEAPDGSDRLYPTL